MRIQDTDWRTFGWPHLSVAFPDGSDGKEPACNAGFDPRVQKIPWRREWLPTPVFLPGEFHGQRSLVGYSPQGHKKSDTTELLTLSASSISTFLVSRILVAQFGVTIRWVVTL